jgi:hypothetical protein
MYAFGWTVEVEAGFIASGLRLRFSFLHQSRKPNVFIGRGGSTLDRHLFWPEAIELRRDREEATKNGAYRGALCPILSRVADRSDRNQPAGFWDVQGFRKQLAEPFVRRR